MRIISSKKIKVLISLLLLAICVSRGFIVSVHATASSGNNSSESYTIIINNKTIEYYLDENNMPYVLQNGERMPVALPLEHMQVTDESVLIKLNMQREYKVVNNRSFNPSNYFDMTNGGTYTDTFYLTNYYQDTPFIRINMSHHIIRIRTSNEVKNTIFTGKKISYIVYYYFEPTDHWYNYVVNDINVSNDIGAGLDLNGLYKIADDNMYLAKKEYYSKSEFDRRVDG